MAAPLLKVVASAVKRPVIEIAGVSKTYRTQDGDVPSLRPLDFSVDQASFWSWSVRPAAASPRC